MEDFTNRKQWGGGVSGKTNLMGFLLKAGQAVRHHLGDSEGRGLRSATERDQIFKGQGDFWLKRPRRVLAKTGFYQEVR